MTINCFFKKILKTDGLLACLETMLHGNTCLKCINDAGPFNTFPVVIIMNESIQFSHIRGMTLICCTTNQPFPGAKIALAKPLIMNMIRYST